MLMVASGYAETRDIGLTFSTDEFSYNLDANNITEIIPSSSGYFFGTTSDPGLPMKAISIAVPKGAKILDIATTAKELVVKRNIHLAPNPIPLPTDNSVPFKEWELKDTEYTSSPFQLNTYPRKLDRG